MPILVRVWARTPILNRWANVWLWKHGYFLVYPPSGPPVEEAGVREPRRPAAPASSGAIALVLEQDEDHPS
jgi:hypothetical protein